MTVKNVITARRHRVDQEIREVPERLAVPDHASSRPVAREEAVAFRNVGTRFPGADRDSLSGISFTIARGEIFGVIGTSGAGKSTLVRTINGLHRPTTGAVSVLGRDISTLSAAELRDLRRDVSMVFQHHNLLDSATIAENVGLPLVLAKVDKKEIKDRVRETLELVGLGGRGTDYPAQLSGGQRQRVGIARALVTRPTILLCDEPTSALDPITTAQILDLIGDLAHKLSITVVVITHQMEVIARICDRVAVLDRGYLVEKGPVAKVFAQPGAPLTKRFVSAVLSRELPEQEKAFVSGGEWDTVVAVTGASEQTRGLPRELYSRFGVEVETVYAASLALRHHTISHVVWGLIGAEARRADSLEYLNDLSAKAYQGKGHDLDVEVIYPYVSTDDKTPLLGGTR